MTTPSDGSVDDSADPHLILERAADALKALDSKSNKEDQAGLLATGTVIGIELLALAALCLHTFIESGAPKVDSTSVALLAVILIAPFVSKLKALELGGAKAEWREGATAGLKEILEVLNNQHRAISTIYNEFIPLVPSSESLPAPQVESSLSLNWHLQHIVWVDDHPENNAYEVGSLSQFMQVTTVTSNEAVIRILETGQVDAIISDTGRDADGPNSEPGGVRLLDELNQLHAPRPPIFYYTSSRAVDRYGVRLQDRGALVVTSIFSELLSALRSYDEQLTVASITAAFEKFGGRTVEQDLSSRQLDLVVTLNSKRRIGIEVVSWLRRSQVTTLANGASRLIDARLAGDIEIGWLVIPPSAFDSSKMAWVNGHDIDIVTTEELPQRIQELVAA